MSREPRTPPHGVRSLERIVFLSDAVFGIALTLLVLEIKVPELLPVASSVQLWERLLELWPNLFSYILSFAVIGVYWLDHHRLFRHLVYFDSSLISLNFLFLFFIAVSPFSTALLGRYTGLQTAWLVYAFNMIALGVTIWLIWRHAVRAGLVGAAVTPSLAAYISSRMLVIAVVFAFSILVSFFSVTLAEITPAMLLGLNPLLARRFHHPEVETDVPRPRTLNR
jgi:uncharacterized membrane protein